MIYLDYNKLHYNGGAAYYNDELANGIFKGANEIHCYKNGLLHNDDGPAVIYYNFEFINNNFIGWYINGKKHRIDGPAIQFTCAQHYWHTSDHKLVRGYYQWWYNGKPIDCSSQEEFERFINLIVYF